MQVELYMQEGIEQYDTKDEEIEERSHSSLFPFLLLSVKIILDNAGDPVADTGGIVVKERIEERSHFLFHNNNLKSIFYRSSRN